MTQTVWHDWPAYDYNVATWLQENKLMTGYPDGTFRPWEPVTEYQVAVVAQRAGIRTDVGQYDFYGVPAKMGWVQEYFLPGTVHSAGLDEVCTRYRFAKMLFRHGMNPGPTNVIIPTKPDPDADVIAKLDKWFESTYVNGFHSRLVGMGKVFVKDSRETGVPLWLALGQCWRESQFFTTGLSRQYNMGWGIKDSKGRWGSVRSFVGSGYTDYVSVEESIHAYFRLMSSPDMPYKSLIEQGRIREALNIYAPPFENDANEHYNIVMTVKRWTEERGIR